ncbi:hypothetical protein GCK72_005182 [Caenorhabditis remanei]|uniref:Uncharacterized protein n=1 Tax=Caenorhabditis remanei TaxID=31234 RepID=A0A6A5HBU0_CAERE|nr:hypothetical protein GCK72_005182 [Caenorhabditis remanei]KAF1765230.1 hypothetical protein GCK72_005182 [Caenorhabditis remanei]
MKFQNILFVSATFLFTVVTADTLLRSQLLKKIDKRDTLLKALPVKQREEKRVMIVFKNGENEKAEFENARGRHREDKARVIVTFKNGEVSKQHHESLPIKQREDKKAMIIFKNGMESKFKKIAKRDTLLKSLPTGDKRVQQDALLNALRSRYHNLKGISKRDTLLRSLHGSDKRAKVIEPKTSVRVFLKSGKVDERKPLTVAEKKKDIELKRDVMLTWRSAENKNLSEKQKALLAARQRDAFRAFFKNRRAVAQHDTLLRDENQPEPPRKKRDIAATVVGAAVSSVVSNLMKNVEESVVKAENDAKKVQADLDSDQGRIIGEGEFIVSQDTANFAPNKPPVVHEVVPLPFVPVKAYDAPKSNDIVPKPVAPVHADVEVIAGTDVSSSTSTAKPATERKGVFATLFNSIKLFFGTVTNSVGGFFIDMGSRITNFVEKRIKV